MLKIDQLDPETRQRILAMLQKQEVPVADLPVAPAPAAPETVDSLTPAPAPASRSGRRLRAIAWLAVLVVSVAFACQALAAYSRYEKVRVAALNDAPAINDGLPLHVSPEEEAYLKRTGLVPWKWQNGTSLKGKQSSQQVSSGTGTISTAEGTQKEQPLDWRNTDVDWATLEKRLEPYVFRITSDRGTAGTAFLPRPENLEDHLSGRYTQGQQLADYLYTAYHITGGSLESRFRIEGILGSSVSGKHIGEAWLLEKQPKCDLAILNWSPPVSGDPANAPSFGSAYVLKPGDLVLVLGNPHNMWDAGSHPGPISTVGRVLAVNVPFKEQGMWTSIKHGLKIQADIAPGNSGSPVFNSRGEVVGMVVAGGLPEPDPTSGVNRIVAYAVMFPLR